MTGRSSTPYAPTWWSLDPAVDGPARVWRQLHRLPGGETCRAGALATPVCRGAGGAGRAATRRGCDDPPGRAGPGEARQREDGVRPHRRSGAESGFGPGCATPPAGLTNWSASRSVSRRYPCGRRVSGLRPPASPAGSCCGCGMPGCRAGSPSTVSMCRPPDRLDEEQSGANGAGKSTLLAVLAGRLEAKGDVHRRRGLTVGLLAEAPVFGRPDRMGGNLRAGAGRRAGRGRTASVARPDWPTGPASAGGGVVGWPAPPAGPGPACGGCARVAGAR